MQITLTNKGPATVRVDWDAKLLPANTHAVQFRVVSYENNEYGYINITSTNSPLSGHFVLNTAGSVPPIIMSGELLLVMAAAQDSEYIDLEGSNVAAIVPI